MADIHLGSPSPISPLGKGARDQRGQELLPVGGLPAGNRVRGARNAEIAQHLAAIVEFSDDAIISMNIDAVIATWNRSAERLFGYTAEEAIGKPITIIVPDDRPDEEPFILARIRRGERSRPLRDRSTTQRWNSDRHFTLGLADQECERRDCRRVQDCA